MHSEVEQEGLYQNCEIHNRWVSGSYTPVENGTYYGMVLSVHPSVRHTLDNDSFRSFSQ
jgi:hypothetical protein